MVSTEDITAVWFGAPLHYYWVEITQTAIGGGSARLDIEAPVGSRIRLMAIYLRAVDWAAATNVSVRLRTTTYDADYGYLFNESIDNFWVQIPSAGENAAATSHASWHAAQPVWITPASKVIIVFSNLAQNEKAEIIVITMPRGRKNPTFTASSSGSISTTVRVNERA